MSMFGVICAGREAQTDFQQVDSNKYGIQIQNGGSVNHIVVFLLPGATLDPTVAASVYFQLPGTDFQLLGALSSNKPSAIFKLKNTGSLVNDTLDPDEMVDEGATQEQVPISIGISIEPINTVEQQLAQLKASRDSNSALVTASAVKPTVQNSQQTAVLANKIIQNAYNYLSGFTVNNNMVSMNHFNDWWNKFKSKMANNPSFLDNLD